MTYRPYADISSSGPAGQLAFNMNNTSGGTLAALQPVAVDTSGNMAPVAVSSDLSLTTLGLLPAAVANGASGSVSVAGVIQAVTTSFSFGDTLYVGHSGLLTNVKPSIGSGGFVAGDWVVMIGTIVQNVAVPSQKDLAIAITKVGTL
jgi:hypothetical protein